MANAGALEGGRQRKLRYQQLLAQLRRASKCEDIMWLARYLRAQLTPLSVHPASPSPGVPQIPRPPWFYRASPLQVQLAAVALGVIIFAIGMLVDLLVYRTHTLSAGPVFAFSNALIAVVAASFAYVMVRHANERREAVHQRLHMVAELNHHIRNALHLIHLSAHTTHDEQAIAVINEAGARIDWALKEILALDPRNVQGSAQFGTPPSHERSEDRS